MISLESQELWGEVGGRGGILRSSRGAATPVLLARLLLYVLAFSVSSPARVGELARDGGKDSRQITFCYGGWEFQCEDSPPLMFGFEMRPTVAIPGSGAGGKTPRATRKSFVLLYFKTLKAQLLNNMTRWHDLKNNFAHPSYSPDFPA